MNLRAIFSLPADHMVPNYSCHLFWELRSVHIKTRQTGYEVCLEQYAEMKFLHHFSSAVHVHSRQLGETQQMVTSVHFSSHVTPLEHLIICGLADKALQHLSLVTNPAVSYTAGFEGWSEMFNISKCWFSPKCLLHKTPAVIHSVYLQMYSVWLVPLKLIFVQWIHSIL